MAIEKRYLHYNTESAFLTDKNNGQINPKSIVFISEKGKRAIYTHGKFFSVDSFVLGTQTSGTSQFTGIFNGTDELYDGLSIKYWLPYASTGIASLNLTIQGTETGDIPIYTQGNTRYEDTISENCVLFLVYRSNVDGIGAGWWAISGTGTLSGNGSSGNYTFVSGTDGTFKVVDGEGTPQTVSIGKPKVSESVSNPLTIQVNSGSTDGTDLYTFNGSESKTINIKGSGVRTPESGTIEISGGLWTDIQGKPETFKPEDHTHEIEDLTGITTKEISVNGKNCEILCTEGSEIPGAILAPEGLGTIGQVLMTTETGLGWGNVAPDNTWRPVFLEKIDGSESSVTSETSKLKFKEGNNITLSKTGEGEIEISSFLKTYALQKEITSEGYKISIEEGSEGVTIPIFSSETLGLTPRSTGKDKFLKGDGTWSDIPFQFASTTSHGYAPQLVGSSEKSESGWSALMWSGKVEMTTPVWSKLPDKAFSWRTIKVDNTDIGEDSTLNLVGGTNISLLNDRNGTITINSSYKNSLSKLYIGAKDSDSNGTAAKNPYIKLFDGENGTPYQFKISGSGSTSVSSDESGNLTIKTDPYIGSKGVTVSGVNITHDTYKTNVDDQTDTASTLGYGSEFIVNNAIVTDNGHITGFTKRKYVLPYSDNSDEKVKISEISGRGEYSILFGRTQGETEKTEGAGKNKNITINPETKTLTSGIFKSTEKTEAPFIVASSKVVKNLNASFLEGHSASFFSKDGHTHPYLPLSGGTLESSNFDNLLNLKRTVNSGEGVALWFSGNEGKRGAIGFTESSGNLLKWKPNGNVVTILDTENTSLTKTGTSVILNINGVSESWVENKVEQKSTSVNSNYPILMAGSTSPDGSINVSQYNKSVTINPSTGTINATKINGEFIGTINGNVTGITKSNDTNDNTLATTEFVKTAVGTSVGVLTGALVFKNVINSNSDLPKNHDVGWVYRVNAAGTYAGQNCEIGDLVICIKKGTTADNSHWTIGQNNIDGAVVSGSASTEGNFASFLGNTGKVVKDSGYKPSDFIYTAKEKHLTLLDNEFALHAINSGSLLLGSQGSLGRLTLESGGSFIVPKIEVDLYGRTLATGSSNITVTLPATNVVQQNASNSNTPRPLLLGYYSGTDPDLKWTSGESNVSYYSKKISVQAGSGTINAVTFNGALIGNASTASALVDSSNSKITAGGAEKPVYFDQGVPVVCSKYAGGTQVKLNGDTHAGEIIDIYAPTNSGAPGLVLTSTGGVPEWKDILATGSYTRTVSVAISTNWSTLLSGSIMNQLLGEDIGTYVIQVISSKAGVCSGIMSWNTSGTTMDEILLHRTGASTNIYLRLSSRVLQVAAASSIERESIKITFKKLI